MPSEKTEWDRQIDFEDSVGLAECIDAKPGFRCLGQDGGRLLVQVEIEATDLPTLEALVSPLDEEDIPSADGLADDLELLAEALRSDSHGRRTVRAAHLAGQVIRTPEPTAYPAKADIERLRPGRMWRALVAAREFLTSASSHIPTKPAARARVVEMLEEALGRQA